MRKKRIKKTRKLDIPGANTDKVVELADKFWARIMKLTKNDSYLGWMAISRLQGLHIKLKLEKSRAKEEKAGLVSDE